jgi:hypothetical protein
MLLGLVAAVVLAVLLQLGAGRSRRPAAFEFAADGIIDLRCWVVLETPARLASSSMLALPSPRRPARPPLKLVGEMRMLARRPARRPLVRTPPDVIVVPDDILAAVAAARKISASIWQSPPGQGRAAVPAAVTLH